MAAPEPENTREACNTFKQIDQIDPEPAPLNASNHALHQISSGAA